MADFSITVDTHDMARSIDSVTGHVRGVNAAVVAMETAVVAAQNKAARDICNDVDNGFYVLMQSQLNQKIAAISSEMYSSQHLMETFRQEIDRLMLVMQDDYNRIKRRYLKQFTSLDNALDTRVHELDKRAYELSRSYKASLFSATNEVMKAVAFGDETQFVNVQETNALIKNRSSRAIGIMSGNIMESVNYTKTLDHILKAKNISNETEQYLPVVFVESESMISEDVSVKNYYVPQNKSLPEVPVVTKLQQEEQNFNWSTVTEADYEGVKNYFLKKCNSGEVDERVAGEMIRLFESSKWNSNKEEQL